MDVLPRRRLSAVSTRGRAMEQDVRVARTHRYLVEAMTGLMVDKPVCRIQVRELCQFAQVNRTTFYKHYDNIEDFVSKVVDVFIREMDANFGGANIFSGLLGDQATTTLERCVCFMMEHLEFVRAMTGPHGTPLLRERICDHWREIFEEAVRQSGCVFSREVNPEVLDTFVVSSLWALLEHSIRASDTYAPAYLAAQSSYLLHDCVFSTLMSQGGEQ